MSAREIQPTRRQLLLRDMKLHRTARRRGPRQNLDVVARPCLGSGVSQSQAAPAAEELARKLGGLDATAPLVGSMIGSGIFIAPSLMARNIAAPGIYLGLWILGGLFTLLGAWAYAELA